MARASLLPSPPCVRIAVLANMAFRQPIVQQQIRQLGGVELLLSQCQASTVLIMIILLCFKGPERFQVGLLGRIHAKGDETYCLMQVTPQP